MVASDEFKQAEGSMEHNQPAKILKQYIHLHDKCVQMMKDLRSAIDDFKIAKDNDAKFAAGKKLEGLLGINNKQTDDLEALGEIIMTDENLQKEFSKHYNVPVDIVPALLARKLNCFVNMYIGAGLVNLGYDFNKYTQAKKEEA